MKNTNPKYPTLYAEIDRLREENEKLRRENEQRIKSFELLLKEFYKEEKSGIH